MSVKRYKLRPIFLDYTSVKSFGRDVIDTFGKESAYEHGDGDYVRYDDYATLKAEVERFKFTLEEERQITRQDWAGLRCEHDRVKRALEQAEAEVERLRKAGDELLDGWIGMYGDHEGSRAERYIKLWKEAKEGKQS